MSVRKKLLRELFQKDKKKSFKLIACKSSNKVYVQETKYNSNGKVIEKSKRRL